MSVPDMSREVAIGLYGAVDWASFGRVGLLSAEAVASLAAGEAGPLSVVLADGAGARDYAAALASVVGDVSDVAAQRVPRRFMERGYASLDGTEPPPLL